MLVVADSSPLIVLVNIGHIELPNLHVSTPSIKVTTPAPDLGGQSNGEAPTQTNQGATG